MECIQKLNNGYLVIKPLTIWRALLLLLFMLVFESILYLPVQIGYELLSSFGDTEHYFGLVGELAVKVYVFSFIVKRSSEEGEGQIKSVTRINYGFWILIVMVGVRLFYNHSIGPFVETFIQVDPYLVEAFDDLLTVQWVGLVSILVFAPIFEELIFRGIVMKGLLRTYSPSVAIFVSALFFAIYHMSFLQGVNAFYIGIIIGIIYFMTKSIYWAITAHFLNNAYVMFIGDITYLFDELGLWMKVGISFFGFLLIVWGFYYLNKTSQEQRNQAYY